MKLHLKEDPKEWRKATLLSLIGPSVLIGILRWRGVVSWNFLAVALALIALVAICACARPRWFRGYYRFGTRVGFFGIQLFGKVVLLSIFFLVLTPLGWMLRLTGKDLLQLKNPGDQQTYWHPARQDSSLDRMF